MAVSQTTVTKSSDKSFYKEEDKEVTFVRHRSTIDDEELKKLINQSGAAELNWDRMQDPSFKVNYSVTSHSSTVRTREPIRQTPRGNKRKVPLVLLLLAALAAGFYYIYFYVMGYGQAQ